MSRFSNLFAAGIFIVFLAVLFHYFCRVRKKPEMIVQQHVQVPEGYIYPITSNINNASRRQIVLTPNFGHFPGPFMTSSSMGYPVNSGTGLDSQFPYNYNHSTTQNTAPPAYPPRNEVFSNPARPNIPEEDPPPYHIAVAGTPYLHPK